MKIAFFTENNFTGKIPRTYDNMRTEFSWMCALNADHYNIDSIPEYIDGNYDIGICILPKNNKKTSATVLYENLNSICYRTAVMQEGPNWYWQDYDIMGQFDYYSFLNSVDIIFTHNESDILYYKGHFPNKPIYKLQSLIIEDVLPIVETVERNGIIIGGNFCSWYGGFDSYVIAKQYSEKVCVPSMGRKIENEELVTDLIHLSYMNWKNWMIQLNTYKVGVHLMRTHAAGTFALNCASLGIPCIGYRGLDTQEILHPECTADSMIEARHIIERLRDDSEFYNHTSELCYQNYKSEYNEQKFKQKFYENINNTAK